MSALWRFVRLGGPLTGRLLLAVAAGVAAAAAAIGLTATSAWLISRAAEQPPVLYLMVAIVAVRAFGIGRGVLRYAERLAAHDAAFRILARLRAAAYVRLERLAPAGLADFRSGDLLSRLVADVDGLADLWLRVLLPYAVAMVASLATCLLVGWLAPAAGIVLALTLLFVAFAVPVVTAAVATRGGLRVAEARGDLAAATVDLLAGAPELMVAGATTAQLAAIGRIDERLARAEGRMAMGAGLGALLSGLGAGVAVWLGLVAGIAAVRAGSIGGVALAVVAITPIAVHEVVAALVPAAQHVPGLVLMAERVGAVLDQPDPVREPALPASLPGPAAGPFGLRTRGLVARYPGAAADALVMPDLDLPAGGRMLVTGPSGSGKSTFGTVLLRFLDASAGSVELVGASGAVALAALAGDDVRRAICLCAQDPHVFDTSVVENIRFARPSATESDLRAALASAQLLSWAESLPNGWNTLVGEHGARLSGGQRQRLALARALLADAPVVVFDEPTEHVDEPTARALVRDLLAACAGRTVVVITHRPDLMEDVTFDVRVALG